MHDDGVGMTLTHHLAPEAITIGKHLGFERKLSLYVGGGEQGLQVDVGTLT